MSKTNLILFILFLSTHLLSQSNQLCYPVDVLVAADSLNFREGSSIDRESKGKLERGEKLAVLEVIENGASSWTYDIRDNWLRVKREINNDTGYVFGQFVRSAECAYVNYADEDRIQVGYWYGLSHVGDSVWVEPINPEIRKERSYEPGLIHSSIVSGGRHKLLICSQEKLKEGAIKGMITEGWKGLKVGDIQELLSWWNNDFFLMRTGEYGIDENRFAVKNHGMYLMKRSKNRGQESSFEDLGECLHNFSHEGIIIRFAGDLNDDGIPEIILNEGDNKIGVLYYFKSNKEGVLELECVTYSYSKC